MQREQKLHKMKSACFFFKTGVIYGFISHPDMRISDLKLLELFYQYYNCSAGGQS